MTIPQWLVAGEDIIVDSNAVKKVAATVPNAIVYDFDGFYHELLFDDGKEAVVHKIRDILKTIPEE